MSKKFHIGTVLTVTTGYYVVQSMGEVYGILNHMTGDDIFTHRIPRAMRECAPWLLRQHPALADVDTKAMDTLPEDAAKRASIILSWIAQQVERFGEYLEVEPIPADDHARRDPVEEAQQMFGADRVIVVDPDA